MLLSIVRDTWSETATLGAVYLDGRRMCDSLEDRDRALDQLGPAEAAAAKVRGATAIPCGTYVLGWTRSQRFGRHTLELLNVPNFAGVRVHAGNTEADTRGCVLVGQRGLGCLRGGTSRPALRELEAELEAHLVGGGRAWCYVGRTAGWGGRLVLG